MFYWYHQPPIGLSGAESIWLETSVLDPVPDPFYLFPLDLTATYLEFDSLGYVYPDYKALYLGFETHFWLDSQTV